MLVVRWQMLNLPNNVPPQRQSDKVAPDKEYMNMKEYESKACHWIPPFRKHGAYWLSSKLSTNGNFFLFMERIKLNVSLFKYKHHKYNMLLNFDLDIHRFIWIVLISITLEGARVENQANQNINQSKERVYIQRNRKCTISLLLPTFIQSMTWE